MNEPAIIIPSAADIQRDLDSFSILAHDVCDGRRIITDPRRLRIGLAFLHAAEVEFRHGTVMRSAGPYLPFKNVPGLWNVE